MEWIITTLIWIYQNLHRWLSLLVMSVWCTLWVLSSCSFVISAPVSHLERGLKCSSQFRFSHTHMHTSAYRDLAAIQILCLLCLHFSVVPPKQKFSLWRNKVACAYILPHVCLCLRIIQQTQPIFWARPEKWECSVEEIVDKAFPAFSLAIQIETKTRKTSCNLSQQFNKTGWT